jgi:hypothetical protein
MILPDFHDGDFDGLRLGLNGTVYLFLRTSDQRRYTVCLRGVQALTLSDVKAGNIILDLVLRRASELTSSDVAELYHLDENSERVAKILHSTREKELCILELNATYGAQGLFLFQNYEVGEPTDEIAEPIPPLR